MKLFSAPGSDLTDKRAWLMTTPFDKPLGVAPTFNLIPSPQVTWDRPDDDLTWDVE